jgi:anti-sigma regulatory factor (Ser/Thr protein kinase)
MCGAQQGGGRDQLVHEALFYRGQEQAVDAVAEFVTEGIERREPALVALPPGRLEGVRGRLNRRLDSVSFADMTSLGVNPGRILPTLAGWLAGQSGPARFVGEPLWPGRRAAERTEVTRHEALINLALRSAPVRVLCTYDEGSLDDRARRDVERTHPVLRGPGPTPRVSASYLQPAAVLRETEAGLSAPEEPVQELSVTEDLQSLRRTVAASQMTLALPAPRRGDFVLAVNEAATNALKYDCPPRAVRLWRSGRYVVCEVVGRGVVDDPLAGRHPPSPAAHRGRGLWMVNQLCDLVELRNHDSRATLRMHMRAAS